jgi:poly(A) polymerase
VATFNLWYSEQYRPERTTAALAILDSQDADVICLQEVTAYFLERVLAEPWVRQKYRISHKDAKSLGALKYATVMLSKLQVVSFSSHDLPSFMDRKLIVGELIVAEHHVLVATVHLESEMQVGQRQNQMACMHQWLGEKNMSYVIAGDFNFGTNAVENEVLQPYDWHDVWAQRFPHEDGFTRDTETNSLLRGQYPDGLQARFDRIVTHSAISSGCILDAFEIHRLGVVPISDELPTVHPSDHYGLAATVFVLNPEQHRRRHPGSPRCAVQ